MLDLNKLKIQSGNTQKSGSVTSTVITKKYTVQSRNRVFRLEGISITGNDTVSASINYEGKIVSSDSVNPYYL